jgi:hypothetical protein
MNCLKKFSTLVLFITIFISACQENDHVASHNPTPGSSKINVLVEKLSVEESKESLNAISKEIAALTAEELNSLNEAREKLDIQALEVQYKSASLSEAEFDNLKDEANAITKLRLEVNNLSVENYGKPYNQISSEQLDELFPKVKSALLKSTSVSNAKETSCASGAFPVRAYRGAAGIGATATQNYLVKPNGQFLCDFVFTYRGNYTRIFPTTSLDHQLITLHNNQVLKRNLGLNTEIVFDYNKIILIYGNPSRVKVKMF